MRVAVVTAPEAVELREEPVPAVGTDEVLVEVGACGLCTMERRLFLGRLEQLLLRRLARDEQGQRQEAGRDARSIRGDVHASYASSRSDFESFSKNSW